MNSIYAKSFEDRHRQTIRSKIMSQPCVRASTERLDTMAENHQRPHLKVIGTATTEPFTSRQAHERTRLPPTALSMAPGCWPRLD